MTLRRNNARFVPDLQRAVDEALAQLGRGARVLVLPEAANTLPMPRFHSFPELKALASDHAFAADLLAAAG